MHEKNFFFNVFSIKLTEQKFNFLFLYGFVANFKKYQ